MTSRFSSPREPSPGPPTFRHPRSLGNNRVLNKFNPDPLAKWAAPTSSPARGAGRYHSPPTSQAPLCCTRCPSGTLGCSPRSAPAPASPAEPSPPTRTFALSQPLCRLLSPLVNIDLHIRLNIDIEAGSPFPTRASKPETATWNHRFGSHLSLEKGGSGDSGGGYPHLESRSRKDRSLPETH